MKRFAVILVVLALQAAFPSLALGHTDGGFNRWITNVEFGYNHFVRVCDVGIPDSMEPRIIDALNEWNEVGGELSYAWTNWTDANCDYQMAYSSLPVIKITHGTLGGNTLGAANRWVNSNGFIFNCLVTMDSFSGDPTRHFLTSWGNIDWYYANSGGPGSYHTDWESVLVHEMGHCLSRWGHSPVPPETYYQIMDMCHNPNPACGDPRTIENDERLYTHDSALYYDLYGTTH